MKHTVNKNRSSFQKRLWFVAEAICFLILVFLLVFIFIKLHTDKQIIQEEKESSEWTTARENTTELAIDDVSPQVPLHNGFSELVAQNNDFRGLLSFGIDHSLYVCQAADNLFYMNHQFDKTENPAGMIFMDYRNTLSPRSDNLILYGHNMRNGSRFGTLNRYTQAEYLIANPLFHFADLYETRDYIPFAVFHTTVLTDAPSYFPFDQINFADEAAFDAYVKAVKDRSVLDLPVEVKYGDHLLTLATCSSEQERGRLVIVCRAK